MKPISAWKTDDGKVFEDVIQARNHEAVLELEAWAESRGICAGGPWTVDMVVGCLLDDANQVEKSLAKFLEGKAEEDVEALDA